MTTVEKAQKVLRSKNAIYNAILQKGINITPSTKFNQYANLINQIVIPNNNLNSNFWPSFQVKLQLGTNNYQDTMLYSNNWGGYAIALVKLTKSSVQSLMNTWVAKVYSWYRDTNPSEIDGILDGQYQYIAYWVQPINNPNYGTVTYIDYYAPGGIQALTSYRTSITTACRFYFEIQGGDFKRQSSIYFGNSYDSQGYQLYTEQGSNAALSQWPLNNYWQAFADIGYGSGTPFALQFANSSNVWTTFNDLQAIANTYDANVEVKCSMDPYTDFGFNPGFY